MMITKSCIVRSTAGRDKGRAFVVLELVDGQYALLADGRMRRLEKPKRKKLKHLVFESDNRTRLGEKIEKGEKLTNAEIRRTLADHQKI